MSARVEDLPWAMAAYRMLDAVVANGLPGLPNDSDKPTREALAVLAMRLGHEEFLRKFGLLHPHEKMGAEMWAMHEVLRERLAIEAGDPTSARVMP